MSKSEEVRDSMLAEQVEKDRAELARIEEVRNGLIAQADALFDEANAIRRRIASAEFGVRIGSIARSTVRGQEVVVRVTRVDVSRGFEGVQRKKDGTFGTRVRMLYSGWEVIG